MFEDIKISDMLNSGVNTKSRFNFDSLRYAVWFTDTGVDSAVVDVNSYNSYNEHFQYYDGKHFASNSPQYKRNR